MKNVPTNRPAKFEVRRRRPRFFVCMFRIVLLIAAIQTVNCGTTLAQSDLMPSHEAEINVESGDYYNHGQTPEIVWTKTINVNDAQWVRLNFSHLVLAFDQLAGTSSTLRIESLKDGAFQILDGKTARQWHNTSAYFNGSSVRLDLIAWPNGRMNRVTVDSITAGEIPVEAESICDSVDDRILSNDPRAGRTAPGGCTGWLFNDRKHCMLTAGHCASSTDVMLFNVPLSSSNGSYNFPSPNDQYSVDQASVQFVNGGVGNDWCYFGCFANSNTGLTAFQAQGDSYQLVVPPAINNGDQIRITGYGTTTSPVNPRWNGAQKTQVGPYAVFNGSQLGYRTDTSGGNSGSPVIFEATGMAIGIHTHGGCSSGGAGSNSGTGANNAGFQNALANPLGICEGGLEFQYPNGRPALLAPSGGTVLRVIVVDNGDAPQPGTGMLHYDLGQGFQAVAMDEVSPNVYDAVFPASECGSVVDYYISAESVGGESSSDPSQAPSIFYSVLSAQNLNIVFEDNFQTNQGWQVTGDATDGQWQQGVPAGGGTRGDPPTDGDGSGACYVTDNVAGNSDVDGGSTVLTSPLLDASISGGQEAIISYYRWYSNDFGSAPMEDIFEVEISNDDGNTWVPLETVGPTGPEVSGGWFQKSFVIDEFISPTNEMRLRFTASDLLNGSVVEAGVDGVKIEIIECQSTVELAPESFDVSSGEVFGGDLSDLLFSDDNLLLARKKVTQIAGGVTVDLKSTSHTEIPTAFEFLVESSVLARRDIQQIVELYNYDSDSYEELDVRSASRIGDIIVTVTPPGDLSRFVQPGTRSIEARLRFESASLRERYAARIDQIKWTVTN